MNTSDALRQKISEAMPAGPVSVSEALFHSYAGWIAPLENSLKLFREGGFASIDEFCYLLGATKNPDAQNLKKVIRLALAVPNPEAKYEDSDYYPFIQKLFQPDLKSLREDTVVLSYNYDIYLEWLLQRALRIRLKASQGEISKEQRAAITSGLFSRDTSLIENGRGFCLLKLHGSVAWPTAISADGLESSDITYDEYLGPGRFSHLTSAAKAGSNPPILFPWEIIDENGKFSHPDKFPLREEIYGTLPKAGGYTGEVALHRLFEAIWTRARHEVLTADKISFIGLSMHDYLTNGLRFLFSGKRGPLTVNVTDINLAGAYGREMPTEELDSMSPARRVGELLHKICPAATCGYFREKPVGPTLTVGLPPNLNRIRVWGSFRNFIEREMS